MDVTFQIGDKVTPVEDTRYGNPRPLRKGEVMTVIGIKYDSFLTLVHSDGVRTKGWLSERFVKIPKPTHNDDTYKELFI